MLRKVAFLPSLLLLLQLLHVLFVFHAEEALHALPLLVQHRLVLGQKLQL